VWTSHPPQEQKTRVRFRQGIRLLWKLNSAAVTNSPDMHCLCVVLKKCIKLLFQVLSTQQCNALFSEANLKTKSFFHPGIRKSLREKLPQYFTDVITCVENTFKIENACLGDSGSPVLRYLTYFKKTFDAHLLNI
jgi:hypothetical protein